MESAGRKVLVRWEGEWGVGGEGRSTGTIVCIGRRLVLLVDDVVAWSKCSKVIRGARWKSVDGTVEELGEVHRGVIVIND